MKMKLLSILFLTLPGIALSQREKKASFIYSGLGLTHSNHNVNPMGYDSYSFSPIFGIYKSDKNQNINDFQIYNIGFKKEDFIFVLPNGQFPGLVDGSTTTSTTVNAAYHKIIGLNKKSESNFFLGIGVGAMIFMDHFNSSSNVSTSFPIKAMEIGIANTIKPVVNFAVSDRVFLGLSSNVIIGKTTYGSTTFINPSLEQAEQRTSEFSTTGFKKGEVNFQLLVGVKL